MKKYLISLSALLLSALASAQTIQQIDSLTVKMCETLSKSSLIKPEDKIASMFNAHLPMFLKKLEIKTPSDSLYDRIYFRLQKNCNFFIELGNSLQENKSDWVTLTDKPAITIKKNEIEKFLKGGHFYYKEYDGKIVDLVITPTTWTETFEDKTMSKLKFRSKGNGEFEIEFIESNNLMRKNLSVKGDLYQYGIYAFKDSAYDVWAGDGNGGITAFRIYEKK